MVKKQNLNIIFFKTSHLQKSYRTMTLERKKENTLTSVVGILNKDPLKISGEKYGAFLSLCEGPIPVVRGEYAKFN